eukprot:TRINITY_DN1342_c0_g1_i3.p1 TRINITY_DN1342_c0_g1~~TRINITY_DN1342_c0_g1_i3.p1  ORF type:complete len:315 (+),score=89.94 TRINITY_DN1342_c0_g1_i3:260-1204(+)
MFNKPEGICYSPKNDWLYVCDSWNHRIRKITRDGVVSTFAGSSYGYQDGKGEEAMFNDPYGICYSPQDDCLYVCDQGNHRIRKITRDGVVSTFAGSSQDCQDGKGEEAMFNDPYGICYSPQDNCLYVCDTLNHRIRQIYFSDLHFNKTQTIILNCQGSLLFVERSILEQNEALKTMIHMKQREETKEKRKEREREDSICLKIDFDPESMARFVLWLRMKHRGKSILSVLPIAHYFNERLLLDYAREICLESSQHELRKMKADIGCCFDQDEEFLISFFDYLECSWMFSKVDLLPFSDLLEDIKMEKGKKLCLID